MGKIAFVFTGQGAQYSGMGKELATYSAGAAEVFKMVDEIRPGISKLCFEGSKEELQQTENTQPAIFSVSYAAAETLKENGVTAHFAAGFSAGEVAALTYGGYLEKETAFKYILKRASYMKESGDKNPGVMYAVLGLNFHKVKLLCVSLNGCYPVNYNTENQTSVSCAAESAEEFRKSVIAEGGKAVKLAVSGGFHSPMMEEARKKLEAEFREINFRSGSIPVYANVTAETYTTRHEMFSQINSPVLWYQTILNMKRDGVDTFVELGPGKTLSNMIAKITPNSIILNVEDKESLENTLEVLRDAGK